jgi:sortase B
MDKVKIGKKAIRTADRVVNIIVMFAIILFLAIGCYSLWDSGKVYDAADVTRYEVYKPSTEDDGRSFSELQAINPEVTAWLTVYGTNIDYPVAQGDDNIKYVNTNAEGNYSISGAIFLDSRCSGDFSDFSSILYGHHMEKEAMFGELGLFMNKSYFDTHKYGSLYYGGQYRGLEFFAFLRADAYDGTVFKTKIEGDENRDEYLNTLLDMAEHTSDIQVTPQDKIILLSTCSPSSTNGRDILVGKITDKLYNNPFRTESTDGTLKTIEQSALQTYILIGIWLMILAALIIWLAVRHHRKKRLLSAEQK